MVVEYPSYYGKYLDALDRKIDPITKSLSKPYFNKILKNLSSASSNNAKIIYDYIIDEDESHMYFIF